jgi:hypothetical protein
MGAGVYLGDSMQTANAYGTASAAGHSRGVSGKKIGEVVAVKRPTTEPRADVASRIDPHGRDLNFGAEQLGPVIHRQAVNRTSYVRSQQRAQGEAPLPKTGPKQEATPLSQLPKSEVKSRLTEARDRKYIRNIDTW